MKITIANRFRPFSLEPGTYCLLPGTHLRLQIFPALIRVHDLSVPIPRLITEVNLDITGPIDRFTVQLDLEKGCINVWGKGLKYHIIAAEEPDALFAIITEKELKLSCTSTLQVYTFDPKTHIIGFSGYNPKYFTTYTLPPCSRLSLGCHKAQDWTSVCRRQDMGEIFPFWYRLGQILTSPGQRPVGGTVSLLDACQTTDKMKVTKAFHHLFLAGFEGILSPRLTDDTHQGFHLPYLEDTDSGSSLILLAEGAQLIESLFVNVEHHNIHLLPTLPPSFHSGRLVDHAIDGVGTLHLEWSKKLLKKVVVVSQTNKSFSFHFQKALKNCRIRESHKDRGKQHSLPLTLDLKAGVTYFFDRFQK